jgi:hypothetical protein
MHDSVGVYPLLLAIAYWISISVIVGVLLWLYYDLQKQEESPPVPDNPPPDWEDKHTLQIQQEYLRYLQSTTNPNRDSVNR